MDIKKIRGVIFDLDGTIADSSGDIATAVNYTLKKFNQPVLSVAEVMAHMNHGLRELLLGCFPQKYFDDGGIFDEIGTVYANYYFEHVADRTQLYGGVLEMFHKLSDNGIKLCVLSNKRDNLTKKVINILLPDINFTAVRGAREGFPLKPSPEAALQLAGEMRLPLDEIAICGDSDVDMQTARNAGVIALGVTWGTCTREVLQAEGADFIADNPNDVTAIVIQGKI